METKAPAKAEELDSGVLFLHCMSSNSPTPAHIFFSGNEEALDLNMSGI